MKDKALLLRFVSSDEGVYLDTSGKAQGRGAYICNSPDCLKKAKKARGLERSLKRAVSQEVYAIQER
ncbi:MAG: YlxR family protein [Defluviitaleaceae bacterium]|nr:YlxR family protein [Defluviitaleaceae bacterium]